MELYQKLKIWIIDVDGTLTDGGIYYDNSGNEIKKFSSRDAAGFFAAQKAGMKTMVVTGRESPAVLRRLGELKADYIFQNVRDKGPFVQNFLKQNGWSFAQAGAIGDDLNDLPVLERCGFAACPAGSCMEIQAAADYISMKKGGEGAVRDIIEHVLRMGNIWEKTVRNLYAAGR